MKKIILFFSIVYILNLSATIINIPADQPTIQAGIDVAVDADTVLVQPGAFYENINYNGKNITVASLFLTTQNPSYISQTRIIRDQNESIVTFGSGEDSTAVLSGFSISHGYAENGGGIKCINNSNPKMIGLCIMTNFAYVNGGGIYSHNSNPTLENVTIDSNGASNNGGGIYCCSNSSIIISNSSILENTVNEFGGGIYCEDSTILFTNVTIKNNMSILQGGGLFFTNNSTSVLTDVILKYNEVYGLGGGICGMNNSDLELINARIESNYAIMGGGIYCEDSDLILKNILISENDAELDGGGIYSKESNSIITNVTISENHITENGGGIYFWNSNPSLVNCILWNDSTNEIYFRVDSNPNTITISYSDIQDGEAGIVTYNGIVNWLDGNIDLNPIFLGSGDHDFSLQDSSPCINAGSPDTTGLNLPEYDLTGSYRIFGGRIDMGAYENQNVVGVNENLFPLVTKLNQNHPNPFNPSTTIEFSIQNDSNIDVSIFNIKGQKIKTLAQNEFTKGSHSIIWNGDNESGKPVSSGIYYYQLIVNGKTEAMRKCLLLK